MRYSSVSTMAMASGTMNQATNVSAIATTARLRLSSRGGWPQCPIVS